MSDNNSSTLCGHWEKMDPHLVGTLKQEQMFSEETNLPLFFYVFILFILHANASIRKKKVKKDVENIGYGGRTASNIGYFKSSYRWHLFFRQFSHIA